MGKLGQYTDRWWPPTLQISPTLKSLELILESISFRHIKQRRDEVISCFSKFSCYKEDQFWGLRLAIYCPFSCKTNEMPNRYTPEL